MATRTLTCPACKQTVTTSAAPGQTTTCKKCKSEVRVPLRGVEHARREVTCTVCGATQETSTPPGKKTTCRACQAEVRVPLRDPDEAAAAEGGEAGSQDEGGPDEEAGTGARPVRRRVEAGQTCPYCRTRAPVAARVCPSCKASFGLRADSLPGGRVGGAALLVIGAGGLVALAVHGSRSLRAYGVLAFLALIGARAAFASRRAPRGPDESLEG